MVKENTVPGPQGVVSLDEKTDTKRIITQMNIKLIAILKMLAKVQDPLKVYYKKSSMAVCGGEVFFKEETLRWKRSRIQVSE